MFANIDQSDLYLISFFKQKLGTVCETNKLTKTDSRIKESMWDMVRGGSAEGTARKGPFWSHKILVEIYRVYPLVQKKISQNSVWTLGGAVMRVRSSFLAVNTSHPTSTMNFISLKWSFWSALNAVKISKLATIGNKSNFQFTRAISPKIPRI